MEETAPTNCEKCGKKLTKRADDNIETVKKRLEIYHSQIDPIIKYYDEQGLLDVVDAKDNPERVLERV